jgi:hypothetical protein
MTRVPAALTCSDRKRELYGVDPYFREAWEDMLDLWGDRGATERLWEVAPVVFRPDALVARGVHRGIAATRALGFDPVGLSAFRYDRMTVREGWRYQLNIATRDRIDVMDMILPATDSAYILFRRTVADAAIPASTVLSSYKGPSLPEHREPHHLRAIVGGAQVSVLTYVHIADEPADVVRDLGIFFDRSARAGILRAIDVGTAIAGEVEARVTHLCESIPSHALDFEQALNRIASAAECGECGKDERAAAGLLDFCARVQSGASRHWRGLLASIQAAAVSVDYWDCVIVAATLAEKHSDEAQIVIPDISLADWEARAGR